MRSADLKAGLNRVAALGGQTLAHRSAEGIGIGWRWLLPSALVLTTLLIATWHAGRQSAQLDSQRLSAQMDLLTQQTTSNKLALERQRNKTSELEQALKSSGKNANLGRLTQLHQQLLLAQAEANQYKSIIRREQQNSIDDRHFVDALSAPGAHLLAMKGMDAAAKATAYALLDDSGKLMLIACHLPKLADDRQFQLWIVRKQDPKTISAGTFSADESSRALINFDDPSVPLQPSLLVITEEPQGGSSEPTGTKLLETSVSERAE